MTPLRTRMLNDMRLRGFSPRTQDSYIHTWGQDLNQHIHVHCVVSGGGLGPDGEWKTTPASFFAPVKALSKVFRGKFIASFKRARDELRFAGSTSTLATPDGFQALLDELYAKDWVVYAKCPFAGPQQVLKYLSRYTHRVAISNARILEFDGQHVRFRYKTTVTLQQAQHTATIRPNS